MSSLKNEDFKKMKEIYGDNLINDIIDNKDPSIKYFWNDTEIKNYNVFSGLEETFDYCIKKNIYI